MKYWRAIAAAAVVIFAVHHASAQEAVMEEVRVEATFSSGLHTTRPNSAVEELLERLELRDQLRRERELQEANQGSATKLLDVLKLPAWLPIGFGPSESKVDSFFQQNYMRADLNPPRGSPLFSDK